LGELLRTLRVITINLALVTSDNHGQEGSIVGGNLKKLLIDTDTLLLLISCQNLHQARYTTPNKETQKISTYTQLCEILYADSQYMPVLSSTVASCYCTTAVQMAAPVPVIVTPSGIFWYFLLCALTFCEQNLLD
jgi:hypothetical protein